MKITRFRAHRRGFTLLEILIVVAILGILVSLAIPNFLKSRHQAQKQMCIENLSQIESAKQMWGLESGQTEGDEPEAGDLIGAASYIKEMPRCGAGGDYEFRPIGETALCTTPGHEL